MNIKTRILIILLLPTLFITTTRAQRNDPDATVKALTVIIGNRSRTQALYNVVDEICSHFKKNPAVYTGVAEAFWYKGGMDTARAFKYANEAIRIAPNHAEAYTLKGDIFAYYKDTLTAEKWYDKAIKANPKNPRGYEAMAGIRAVNDPDAAVAILEKLKASNASYPYHLKAARMYNHLLEQGINTVANTRKAISHYEQVEKDSMQASDVVSYATLYRAIRDYQKCIDIASPYKDRFAADPYYNRLCLYSYVDAQQFPESDVFARRLMAAPDSVINSMDYHYFVRSRMGQHKYDAAISLAHEWMKKDFATDDDKQYAIGKIADAYKELGEYDKAEKVYSDYMASREKNGTLSAYDLNNLARMYLDKAEELNGPEKNQALLKADSVYNIMATKFVKYAEQAYSQRYAIAMQIWPEVKEGKAVGIANNLISFILSKPERDDKSNKLLAQMYWYLAYYNLQNDRLRQSKFYGKKVLEIEPDNANALKLVNMLKKY